MNQRQFIFRQSKGDELRRKLDEAGITSEFCTGVNGWGPTGSLDFTANATEKMKAAANAIHAAMVWEETPDERALQEFYTAKRKEAAAIVRKLLIGARDTRNVDMSISTVLLLLTLPPTTIEARAMLDRIDAESVE